MLFDVMIIIVFFVGVRGGETTTATSRNKAKQRKKSGVRSKEAQHKQIRKRNTERENINTNTKSTKPTTKLKTTKTIRT